MAIEASRLPPESSVHAVLLETVLPLEADLTVICGVFRTLTTPNGSRPGPTARMSNDLDVASVMTKPVKAIPPFRTKERLEQFVNGVLVACDTSRKGPPVDPPLPKSDRPATPPVSEENCNVRAPDTGPEPEAVRMVNSAVVSSIFR